MLKNRTLNRAVGIVLALGIVLLMGSAQEADLVVGPNGDYATIQAAIDVAITGDIIDVQSGVYKENVNVNKQLVLRGVDTDGWMPVVDAGGNGSSITISANGVVLESFCAANAGPYPNAGIKITSDQNVLAGNSVWNNEWWGIYLLGSDENLITGCSASKNGNDGILLYKSKRNSLRYNVVSNNDRSGIQLLESDENALVGNSADANIEGIFLDKSENNIIRGNAIKDNEVGIRLLSSTNNTVGPDLLINNTQDSLTES